MQQIEFHAADGVTLSIYQAGSPSSRPLLLLHGLFSSAEMNWMRFGHAAKLADAGYHVVMPDFRAHGDSEAPQNAESYPTDILVHDILALLDDRGWDEFDLGGFSLGARTAAKLLVEGLRPRRTMLMGMGWEGLGGWSGRLQFFIDAINNRNTVGQGDPHWMAVNFMKSQKMDPIASRHLLHSFGDLDVNALAQIDLPIGVICGAEDKDNGSAQELTDRLVNGHHSEIPGTHMSSVTKGEMGDAMVAFLSAENEG